MYQHLYSVTVVIFVVFLSVIIHEISLKITELLFKANGDDILSRPIANLVFVIISMIIFLLLIQTIH